MLKSTPIRRMRSRCCPRAASGHAAAAPLSSVMNSRRFSWSDCIRCPQAGRTHAAQQTGILFDHLVGSGKQFVWDGEAERLGGLEVDDQLEPCRHLHGKIGRLLALEDAVDISRRQAKLLTANVTIRDQAARF